MTTSLHSLVRTGDVAGTREMLRHAVGKEVLNQHDQRGFTPLMYAARRPQAGAELLRLLLEKGARVDQVSRKGDERSVMACALGGGDPRKVSILMEAGASLHYRRTAGYDALIDAVHSRDIFRDSHLVALLRLLAENGVERSGVSSHGESGLRVLSRIGRFDAVRLLLQAGAAPGHLGWTPLMHAVALGSLADVRHSVDSDEPLEETDWWQRTAWLIAILTGDTEKAEILEKSGADTTARGRCGCPPLFYAIQGHHPVMLKRLLGMGCDVEQRDDFDSTPLIEAIREDDLECVQILVRAGADPNRECNGAALSHAGTAAIAVCLISAGADPQHMSSQARRALVGGQPYCDEGLLDCSREDFVRDRTRRFGRKNPEEALSPFWTAMVRAGVSAYQAAQHFGASPESGETPVWCAERFGQTLTLLDDGRAISIGGEHEDSYDPDFCIYNDVFVREPDGAFRIYSYPEATFPPTDFHTATLVDDSIYIIGSLGYHGARRYGETQVLRLNTLTLEIERLSSSSENPGWIYKHRANRCGAHQIEISDGIVVLLEDGQEVHEPNGFIYTLDLRAMTWQRRT